MRDVVIVGTGHIAEVVFDYFSRGLSIRVCGFSDYDKFISKKIHMGLPLVPFSSLTEKFPPDKYKLFVAIGYKKLNHLRADAYKYLKSLGYSFVSYVSSNVILHPTVDIGENVFIFELNNIQYKARIGNNVILWSGNHIGHDTVVRDNVYIASHVVVSGFCDIGEYSFLGVNVSVSDEVKIGSNCLIGMGACVTKDIEDNKVFVPPRGKILEYKQLSTKIQEMYSPEGIINGMD